MNNKLEVIGIDHGWSMMKTISQVFVTGVKEITTTPALFGDVLEYEGKFYKVGTVRQEVKDTKVEDDSFYLLTLAAVAKELKRRGLAEAKVFLAVGLPLTRFGAEKNDFIKYLTKNKRVSFKYENEPYYIEIDDVAVFPQCYAAVVDKIPTMAKKTLIVDIGSWTIDIMPVINKSPDESKCVTIPKGLITCMRSINEQCVRQLNGEVDESEIQNIMRYGRSDIDDEY
ncbi:ParM/StbA family protein, partial [Agathobacter rectalis]